jgi:O-antigen/teichoic acid export membrane protein
MTAVNPQITKSYASGDNDYMHSLLRKSSRLSFYLLFVLSLPMLLNVDFILSLWLKEVPQYTAVFVKLFIIYNLCESISYPLVTAMLATGKIKNYQIVVGGFQLLNLPVSYVFLKMGYPPEITVVVAIVVSQICLAARLIMLKGMIGLSVKAYLSRVYFNLVSVAVIASVVSISIVSLLPSGTLYSCISIVMSVLIAGGACLFIGCASHERQELLEMVKNKIGYDKD